MYRHDWLMLEARYGAPIQADGMTDEAVAADLDAFASLRHVVSRILATEYASLFAPVVSMGATIHEYPTDDIWAQDDCPAVHFTAFTRQRFDISYFHDWDDDDEVWACEGVEEAANQILTLLERLKRDTEAGFPLTGPAN